MQETWERSVPCRDRAQRNRLTKVLVTEDREIAVIPPPGECGIWDPSEVDELMQAIAAARVEALHRRGRF